MSTETFRYTTSGQPWIKKDPDAVLDYTFQWDAWLDDVGDTIASADAAVDEASGCTVERVEVINAAKQVQVWVSGGTEGKNATLRCRITTTSSPTARVDDRSVTLRIRSR